MDRSSSPWPPATLMAWAMTVTLGAAIIVVAWVAASGQSIMEDQTPWFSVAVTGLITAVGGHAFAIGSARRRVQARRNLLLVRAMRLQPENRPPSDDPVATDLVVAGDGRRFFHRPTCGLVAGRPWRPMMRSDLDPERQPCGICRP